MKEWEKEIITVNKRRVNSIKRVTKQQCIEFNSPKRARKGDNERKQRKEN